MSLKYWFFPVIAILIVLFSSIISAPMLIPASDIAKENAQAPEHSPVISDNWNLERVDFIHYARGIHPAGGPKADNCYKLMGVKWATLPVNYIINPTNPQNLTTDFVTSAISTSAETWDTATTSELFNNSYSIDNNAQYGLQDFQNAIAFGDYPSNGVIAVTSVWFTRFGKRIVEFDMLFNTRFNWGDATANSTAMDLQNIATHELGHSVGLSDIYNSTCSTVTMYGYSNNGDLSKRTLEQPDILGLQKMYGA